MKLDMEQFRQVFLEECAENLEVMEQELLNLDIQAPDSETINTIFRAAHSIKGGGATFDFNDISEFTHGLETLLDEVREAKRTLTESSVDLLLRAVDCIQAMLHAHQQKEPLDYQMRDALRIELDQLLKQEEQEPATVGANSVSAEMANSGQDWLIEFCPHKDLLFSGNEPIRILREVEELGRCVIEPNITKLPALEAMEPECCYLSWNISLDGQVSQSEISEVFEWVEDECDLSISRQAATTEQAASQTEIPSETSTPQPEPAKTPSVPASAPPVAAPIAAEPDSASPTTETKASGHAPSPANQPQANKASNSIRVDIDKVDALINLVGELVITQSMLTELGGDFSMEKLERLRLGLDQLLQNTKELQDSVLSIRMLPISFAFNRFPRLVRDLSMQLDKKVDLQISGENTELDKTVMEQIVDPMVHLVRNAIDHGLECPAVRVENGKPEQGIIRLNAFHQGGNIIIEVGDDGAGLNARRLWDKAEDKGLTTALGNHFDEVDEQRIFELIFAPGFSTAEVVSDVSGRGVGMDVVKRNILKLGGQIDVDSHPGKGTLFRISLPLTLAILDGQLVRVCDQIYVVPLVTIIESIEILPKYVNHASGGVELYRLREENIPVIRLNNEFEIGTNPPLAESVLCVVEASGQKIGLLVDELLAQQQVVIKSLETNYMKIDGISGATILGDGSVSLIVDVPGLVSRLLRRLGHKHHSVAA